MVSTMASVEAGQLEVVGRAAFKHTGGHHRKFHGQYMMTLGMWDIRGERSRGLNPLSTLRKRGRNDKRDANDRHFRLSSLRWALRRDAEEELGATIGQLPLRNLWHIGSRMDGIL
jgi:hypothetical protein